MPVNARHETKPNGPPDRLCDSPLVDWAKPRVVRMLYPSHLRHELGHDGKVLRTSGRVRIVYRSGAILGNPRNTYLVLLEWIHRQRVKYVDCGPLPLRLERSHRPRRQIARRVHISDSPSPRQLPFEVLAEIRLLHRLGHVLALLLHLQQVLCRVGPGGRRSERSGLIPGRGKWGSQKG